ILYYIFFFQAEDGIRDFHVTGVQTCALPIYSIIMFANESKLTGGEQIMTTNEPARDHNLKTTPPSPAGTAGVGPRGVNVSGNVRSEERRVGKGGRLRWWAKAQTKERSGRRKR